MNGAGWQDQISRVGPCLYRLSKVPWPGGAGTCVVFELLRRAPRPNPHLQCRAEGLGRESLLPAWAPAFLVPQIWHTQCSGSNLTAEPACACVQAQQRDFYPFLVVFSPEVPVNRKISFASAVEITRSWQSIPIAPPRCRLVDTCSRSTSCLVDTYLSNTPKVRFC